MTLYEMLYLKGHSTMVRATWPATILDAIFRLKLGLWEPRQMKVSLLLRLSCYAIENLVETTNEGNS